MRTIDESIKGAASQNRYGITFDGNIDVMYNGSTIVTYVHHRILFGKFRLNSDLPDSVHFSEN